MNVTNSSGVEDNPPCKVCGTKSFFENKHPEANLFRCPNCSHCFSVLLPGVEPEPYTPEYFIETHQNWFLHPNFPLFDKICDSASKICDCPSVLDVGCGDGGLLKYMRSNHPDWSLSGLDISTPENIEGINFINGDFLTTSIPGTYDVVTSLAAIEHFQDVNAFLSRLSALCRPGGLICVMTLNDSSILYIAARLLKALGIPTAFDRLYGKHHVNHFTTRSLQKLFVLHNSESIRQVTVNCPLASLDFPEAGRLSRFLYMTGVFGAFTLGRIMGRGYLQLILSKKEGANE